MAVKNFAFRGNSAGSDVAGMKLAFFGHFWCNMNPHFVPKGLKYGIS